MNKPAWQRILVLLAGVFMNFVLAIGIFLCIYMSINDYYIAKVSPNNQVDVIGNYNLEVNDEILKIDNKKVYNADHASRLIKESRFDYFSFEVKKEDGRVVKEYVTIPQEKRGYIGVIFDLESNVDSVLVGTPGEKAGLMPGDKVIKVNNNSVKNTEEVISYIASNPENKISLSLMRNNEEMLIDITPDAKYARKFNVDFVELQNLGFFENLKYAFNETIYYIKLNFEGLFDLVRGRTENVEVQGIVGISKQISNTQRAIEFFYLMSAISFSLAIMNLLPIPGLDGGKIVFVIIEMIRKKPVSRETEAKFTLVGFSVLLFLMVWVTLGDISKL